MEVPPQLALSLEEENSPVPLTFPMLVQIIWAIWATDCALHDTSKGLQFLTQQSFKANSAVFLGVGDLSHLILQHLVIRTENRVFVMGMAFDAESDRFWIRRFSEQ
ncbi:hypothetical protein HZ994_11540 [Akkermansiaceae bacterium]|nr:hypothetical protein HZ994_11540 [Akkermansiaceae bacterium]